MTTALFAAVAVLAPLLMLRSRALWRCLGTELVAVLVFGALAAFARPLGVAFDPYLALVAAGAIVLVIVCGFVAFAEEVRWSANHAALLALLFYVLMIPLMLRTPIDGDEPFYLLITESIVHDHDLDLANQFRDIARTASGRTDLAPQMGDHVDGAHVRSHLEPFLPLLMAPGYAMAGLAGALLTIALFGALLARSTVRLFEDEGIADATTRALFPLFAFGPPIVFYAARIWPEVPAAFFFVEAVRGVRQRRAGRWVGAVLGLVFLKLRFILVVAPLSVAAGFSRPKGAGWLKPAATLAALIVLALIAGRHRLAELIPTEPPRAYAIGLFGLALDGASGIAFQAPLYLFGLIALARWRSMPEGFRLGMSSAALYMLALLPRPEWHGGWSPPLRYIVFLIPFLALGAAALYERIAPAPLAIAAAWSVGLVIHGAAFPYRLFHIANGENAVGEWLSAQTHADYSRLFPSFVRPNFAALVAAIALVVFLFSLSRAIARDHRNDRAAIAMLRGGSTDPALSRGINFLLRPTVVAIGIAAAAFFGKRPGDRIDFEDAHVVHKGGEMFPQEYQVARFVFSGGWLLRPGDAMSFLAKRGPAHLRYAAEGGATIQIGARAFVLPSTPPNTYNVAPVEVDHEGRVELRGLAGTVNLDWMRHD
jgi:hypothetical protein